MLSHLPWANKNFLSRVLSPFYFFTLMGPLIGFYDITIRMVRICLGKDKLFPENLLPWAELALIYMVQAWFGVSDVSERHSSLTLWMAMQIVCSCWIVLLGTFAAHHHPDIYRAGDEPRGIFFCMFS